LECLNCAERVAAFIVSVEHVGKRVIAAHDFVGLWRPSPPMHIL
jgi:hypothetical protein